MARSQSATSKAARQKQKIRDLHAEIFRHKTEPSLKTFVYGAWSILEPTTKLQWNWHLDLLCDWLTAVKTGRCRRLIINVPPRSMKSLLCTVFYPVWRWCAEPERRFMFVSYSDELSSDHSVFRRNVLNSTMYRACWGKVVKFSKDQNLKNQYENTRRGVMFSTSVTGSATGKGCDELIVDDPLNVKKAFSDQEREATNRNFDATFRSRLNAPATGTIILMTQPLHNMDLTGHVLAQEPGTWTHIKLPAEAELDESWMFPIRGNTLPRKARELLWPQRFSHEVLAELKTAMGSWWFAGQYQQNPAPRQGAIIKRDWIRYYNALPTANENGSRGTWIQSWDCSFKETRHADYVVGQVWVRFGADCYLVDQIRERMDFVLQQIRADGAESCERERVHVHSARPIHQHWVDSFAGIRLFGKDTRRGNIHRCKQFFAGGHSGERSRRRGSNRESPVRDGTRFRSRRRCARRGSSTSLLIIRRGPRRPYRCSCSR